MISILFLESIINTEDILSEIIKICKNLNKYYKYGYYEPLSFFENKNNIQFNN